MGFLLRNPHVTSVGHRHVECGRYRRNHNPGERSKQIGGGPQAAVRGLGRLCICYCHAAKDLGRWSGGIYAGLFREILKKRPFTARKTAITTRDLIYCVGGSEIAVGRRFL